MAKSIKERVEQRRSAMRAAGMRPIQIWVPDSRQPGFAEECRRQARIIAASDTADDDLSVFLDAALADLPESGA